MIQKGLLMVLIVMGSLLACQTGASDQDGGQEESAAAPQTETTAAQDNSGKKYPSVPIETLEMLWEKCDKVDYVFYNMNFSVNQTEKSAVQNTIRHIAETVPTINPNCKPIGRIFFDVEGKTVLQGDFYISEGCIYFLFYDEKNKPQYANEMTASGVKFFQGLFSRMMPQDQQQGQ